VPDKDELRRSVPLAAVVEAVGIRLDWQGRATCPFHADSTPSFNIWEDPAGVQRWGCFPCGLSGDCFDIVMRQEGVPFGVAVRRVAEIAREAPARTPAPRVKVALDRASLEAYVTAAQNRAMSPGARGMVCVAASLMDEGRPEDLRREYDDTLVGLGWGVDDRANVVVPHYDRDFLMTGAKVRSPDGQKWSFPGSEYDNLYGCWTRPARGDRLLLTEGETDFAHACHYARGDGVAVRSLPSGAGGKTPRPAWLAEVRGFARVYLAFDGDRAGEASTDVWSSYLLQSSDGPEVWRCRIPEGRDLRSCGTHPLGLMKHAMKIGT